MKLRPEINAYQIATVSANNQIHPTLLTLKQLCEHEPALTPGGIRHLIFTKGHDLPGIYRFGRKLLFDRAEFMEGIKKGSTTRIGGRAAL